MGRYFYTRHPQEKGTFHKIYIFGTDVDGLEDHCTVYHTVKKKLSVVSEQGYILSNRTRDSEHQDGDQNASESNFGNSVSKIPVYVASRS